MYRFAARTLTHTVLGFLLLASSAPLFGQGAKVETPGKWVGESQERREDERSFPLARRLWFMRGRQAPKGETPAGARIKAFRQKQALRDANERRFRAMAGMRRAGGVTRFQTKKMVGRELDNLDGS